MRGYNYSLRSAKVRRSFRRAERIQRMSAIHWAAYIGFRPQLIHKGRKP